VSYPNPNRISCKAAVLLGLIGSILPETFSPKLSKLVATSLVVIMNDAAKNPYRLLAIELIGTGFRTWETFLDCHGVLRTLFKLTGLNGQQTGSVAFASAPNMMMSRQTLLAIASVNAALFVSTLTYDLIHASDMAEKAGCLKLLGMFITRVQFS
jgi:hypothetical protein